MTKVTETTLRGDEAVQFVAVMARLDAALDASQGLVHHALDDPRQGSAVEAANKGGRRDPFEQSRLLILSAEDHLQTILLVLKGNVLPMYSLYTLLRPAAEASVRIASLLDPAIDETLRLGRGLNARLDNLNEQSKAWPDAALLASRISQIEGKARTNGLKPVWSKPKSGAPKILGFGEAIKSEVELFRAYLQEGEMIFRYLSAHVHCLPWVVLSAQGARPSGEPGISQLEITLQTPTFVAALVAVLVRHEANVKQLLMLGGYEAAAWDQAREAAMAKARAQYGPLLRPAT